MLLLLLLLLLPLLLLLLLLLLLRRTHLAAGPFTNTGRHMHGQRHRQTLVGRGP